MEIAKRGVHVYVIGMSRAMAIVPLSPGTAPSSEPKKIPRAAPKKLLRVKEREAASSKVSHII
jgi:hypothetical protein